MKISFTATTLRTIVIASLVACSGSTKPTAESDGILVAGSYAGTRTWVQNQCGPNTMLNPLSITVSHARGSTSATVNDGTASFPGTLSRDGSYAIAPISATLSDGTPFSMTLVGAFTRTTLDLRQTVTENRRTGACQYSIDWKTTKSGAPNDIPR